MPTPAFLKSRDIKRQYVLDLLKDSFCMDCGIDDYRVLEFDHREPSDKKYGLAALAKSTRALKTLKEEIAKCDVVCANCHRIRTQLTYGSYRINDMGCGVPETQQ